MNDRYLFRGKRTDNNGWVCGCHIYDGAGNAVIVEINSLGMSEACRNVYPATIGQCTGLRDKHGKLIFEGDILGGKTELVNFQNKPLSKFEESQHLVVWDKDEAKFCTQRIKSSQHKNHGVPEKEEKPSGTLSITLRYYPMIGNIHDNPELCGGRWRRMNKCPHCGYDEYYTKDRYYGISYFNRRFDGSPGEDNSGMYHGLQHMTGKFAYCGRCGKRLFRVNERGEPMSEDACV